MVGSGLGLGWVHRLAEWFEFKIQTFKWPAMTWRGQRIGVRQLGCQDRPTPGLKPKPQGPCPNPSPPRVVAWAFSPNPHPNSNPIPHSVRAFNYNLEIYLYIFLLGK
ncbi:hypothetical protein Hanom_Chr03g00243891 [Helianthus anomalus]